MYVCMYVCMHVYVRTSGVARVCAFVHLVHLRTYLHARVHVGTYISMTYYVYAYAYLGSCVLHALGQP